jgi:uncharacterized protein
MRNAGKGSRRECMTRHCWRALGLWFLMVAIGTASPMKALIVDGQSDHDWKETTPILKKLLEQTGLFAVDVATSPAKGQDMSGFLPNFAPYSVVATTYSDEDGGGDWPDATKKALEKYVAEGGGLVIFHTAICAFPKWKEYNEMTALGGWGGRDEKDGPYVYWKDGKFVRDATPGIAGEHGWQYPFQIVVRNKEHPITKGLPEKLAHAKDELYCKLRGPAKNLTVLATALADPSMGGSGRDEPVLMTVTYGKGRVFDTVIGHSGEQLKSVAFIVTFQRGVEWAATGKVTQEVPAEFSGPGRPSMR